MISLIHPSRGRPRKAFEAATTWINKSGVAEIEYILSIDESEPFAPEYQRLFDGMTYIVRPNRNAVEAINEAAKLTTGDLIIVMSDDFDCPKNWGQIIEKTTRNKKDFLLKVHDGTQNWIVTLPIMDREYYERLGHIYHPNFKHMFCDTWMTHQADATGKLIVRNEVVFKHNHYSVTKGPKDEVSKKADSTWAGGKAAYLWLVRQNFMHLPDYGISELGKSHISWLKQALIILFFFFVGCSPKHYAYQAEGKQGVDYPKVKTKGKAVKIGLVALFAGYVIGTHFEDKEK